MTLGIKNLVISTLQQKQVYACILQYTAIQQGTEEKAGYN